MSFYGTLLLVITYLLLFIGLVFIFDASLFQAVNFFDDEFFFIKTQAIWVVIGSIFLIVLSRIDYHFWLGIKAFWILIGIIASLIAVLILGAPFWDKIVGESGKFLIFLVGSQLQLGGANRWIILQPFSSFRVTIQPAEFAKLGIIIYLTSWLASRKHSFKNFKEALDLHFKKDLVTFLIIIFIISALIIMEPDLGTTMIILGISYIVYFISGRDKYHFVGSLGILSVGIVAVLAAGLLSSYRLQRIQTFMDVFRTGQVQEQETAHSSGYQIQQILIGIGRGGLTGVGLGNSRQQYGFLVENTAFTDSIIAVILEETGFIGSIVIIGIYIFLFEIAIQIGLKAKDRAGNLLALGIGSWICMQALLHIAANTATIPLTGLPMPFLSYGGSSTLSIMMGVGLLLSVDRYN
jgi:cell division protein FtsW